MNDWIWLAFIWAETALGLIMHNYWIRRTARVEREAWHWRREAWRANTNLLACEGALQRERARRDGTVEP